jgi:hypothetical protein
MNVRNLKHILLSIFSDFKSVFQNMMIEFVELLLIDMYVYVFIYIYIYTHPLLQINIYDMYTDSYSINFNGIIFLTMIHAYFTFPAAASKLWLF